MIFEYAAMCTRRVGEKGTIKMEGQRIFLSTSLAGWSVGLKPLAGNLLEVWFGRLLLGQIDLSTSRRSNHENVNMINTVLPMS